MPVSLSTKLTIGKWGLQYYAQKWSNRFKLAGRFILTRGQNAQAAMATTAAYGSYNLSQTAFTPPSCPVCPKSTMEKVAEAISSVTQEPAAPATAIAAQVVTMPSLPNIALVFLAGLTVSAVDVHFKLKYEAEERAEHARTRSLADKLLRRNKHDEKETPQQQKATDVAKKFIRRGTRNATLKAKKLKRNAGRQFKRTIPPLAVSYAWSLLLGFGLKEAIIYYLMLRVAVKSGEIIRNFAFPPEQNPQLKIEVPKRTDDQNDEKTERKGSRSPSPSPTPSPNPASASSSAITKKSRFSKFMFWKKNQ